MLRQLWRGCSWPSGWKFEAEGLRVTQAGDPSCHSTRGSLTFCDKGFTLYPKGNTEPLTDLKKESDMIRHAFNNLARNFEKSLGGRRGSHVTGENRQEAYFINASRRCEGLNPGCDEGGKVQRAMTGILGDANSKLKEVWMIFTLMKLLGR